MSTTPVFYHLSNLPGWPIFSTSTFGTENHSRNLGLIVADAHLVYLKPIELGQNIRVGIRVTRIGNKSLDFDYQIEDADNGMVMGTATTVMVAYNYHTLSTIRVTDEWREAISKFEQIIA